MDPVLVVVVVVVGVSSAFPGRRERFERWRAQRWLCRAAAWLRERAPEDPGAGGCAVR